MIKLKEKHVGKIVIVSGTRYDFRISNQDYINVLSTDKSLSHLFEEEVVEKEKVNKPIDKK